MQWRRLDFFRARTRAPCSITLHRLYARGRLDRQALLLRLNLITRGKSWQSFFVSDRCCELSSTPPRLQKLNPNVKECWGFRNQPIGVSILSSLGNSGAITGGKYLGTTVLAIRTSHAGSGSITISPQTHGTAPLPPPQRSARRRGCSIWSGSLRWSGARGAPRSRGSLENHRRTSA